MDSKGPQYNADGHTSEIPEYDVSYVHQQGGGDVNHLLSPWFAILQ